MRPGAGEGEERFTGQFSQANRRSFGKRVGLVDGQDQALAKYGLHNEIFGVVDFSHETDVEFTGDDGA